MEMELNNADEFVKSKKNENFNGYGDKKLLTKIEVIDAKKRINSYRGINYCVSAPGRLMLFGDHGVTYGTSAVATCINKRTYLRLTENKIHKVLAVSMRDIHFSYHTSFDDIIKFINEDIPGDDLKALSKPIKDPDEINHDNYLEVLKENFNKYIQPVKANKEQIVSFFVFLYLLHGIFYKEDSNSSDKKLLSLTPFIVDISTELMVGAGIGSSASFCVCIAAALLHFKNIKTYGINSAKEITFSDPGLELISKWAFNAEKIMHGQPSGIDSAIVTYGSFIEVVHVDSKRKFIDIPDPPKMRILLIDSGVTRNTANIINSVIMRLYSNPEPFEDILNAIHHVADKAIQLIKTIGHLQLKQTAIPEFQSLEELVTINQGLLYSLGVSHRSLQDICSICSEYNLSAKLTGAGGGGCVFMLVPNDFEEESLSLCVNKLKDCNYEVYDIELGSLGVRLEDLSQLRRT